MKGGVLTLLSSFPNYTTAQVADLAWSGCGDFLVIGLSGAGANQSVGFFQRNGNSFTQLPNPAVYPSHDSGIRHPVINAISFSPDSDFVICYYTVLTVGSFLLMWERSGLNPATAVSTASSSFISGTTASGSNPVAVTGTAAAQNISTTVTVTGTTFTDITSTSTLSGITGPFRWSPDSFLLAATNSSSGNVEIFSRADNVFTAIGGITSTAGYDYAFSPDGNFLAVALLSGLTPYINLYQITNGTTFTPLSNPSTLPTSGINALEWSANSEYLALSVLVSPYVFVYQVSGTTFTHVTDPVSAPAASPTNLSWSPTKKYLAMSVGSSPGIQVYQTASTPPTNGIVVMRGIMNG